MALSSSVRRQAAVASTLQAEPAAVEDLDEEAGVEVTFEAVERLQALGINAADITKLKEGGYVTVGAVLMATSKDLMSVKGLSEAKVEKIREACSKLKTCTFITGTEYRERRKQVIRVTTGSTQLDTLLGGGMETMSITEMFGEFRTGKTQLCHTLCVTSQLPLEMGGGNGKVVYIDTEGTFRPSRIEQIATRYGLDATSVLDNIILARVYTHEQQMDIVKKVAAKMVEDEAPYRVVIVDSVMALFRVDFAGRGELSERQQKLGSHLSDLKKPLAEEFNVVVVLSNQVCADPGANAVFVKDAKKPIGGHILAHASTTRLYLRKGKGEERICKVYDSPSLAESECTFAISDKGIVDAQ